MVLSWRASAYSEGSYFLFLKFNRKNYKVSFQVKALESFGTLFMIKIQPPNIDSFVKNSGFTRVK